MSKKHSISVVFSLMRQIQKSDQKDAILQDILSILLDRGVCQVSDIDKAYERWERLVSAMEDTVRAGVSYSDAYKVVLKDFPEFNFLNLN